MTPQCPRMGLCSSPNPWILLVPDGADGPFIAAPPCSSLQRNTSCKNLLRHFCSRMRFHRHIPQILLSLFLVLTFSYTQGHSIDDVSMFIGNHTLVVVSIIRGEVFQLQRRGATRSKAKGAVGDVRGQYTTIAILYYR